MITHEPTIRRMRKELKAKVRRRLLERMTAQYPLLAEAMMAEEMRKRPGYYAGEEEPKEAEQKAL